jgi:hypothetical protein
MNTPTVTTTPTSTPTTTPTGTATGSRQPTTAATQHPASTPPAVVLPISTPTSAATATTPQMLVAASTATDHPVLQTTPTATPAHPVCGCPKALSLHVRVVYQDGRPRLLHAGMPVALQVTLCSVGPSLVERGGRSDRQVSGEMQGATRKNQNRPKASGQRTNLARTRRMRRYMIEAMLDNMTLNEVMFISPTGLTFSVRTSAYLNFWSA